MILSSQYKPMQTMPVLMVFVAVCPVWSSVLSALKVWVSLSSEDEAFIVHSSYNPKVIRHLVLTLLSDVWTGSKQDRKSYSSSMSAWHKLWDRQTEKAIPCYSILLELVFLWMSAWAETHPNSLWNVLAFIEGYPLKKFNPCEDVSWEKLKYSSKCVFLP